MQAQRDLRYFEGQVERDMMHAETAPLLRKIEELRDEIIELREISIGQIRHARE